MFKKFFVGLFAALMITGCAHVVKEPVPGGSCPSGGCHEELQTSHEIKGTGWSLTLPDSYIIKSVPARSVKVAEGNRELLAMTKQKEPVGRGPIIVTVTVADLDKDLPPEKYGLTAMGALLSQEDIIPLGMKEIKLGAYPGTLTVVLADGNVAIAQLAVGKGARGIMLACGGEAHEYKKVAEACGDVIKSFKLL